MEGYELLAVGKDLGQCEEISSLPLSDNQSQDYYDSQNDEGMGPAKLRGEGTLKIKQKVQAIRSPQLIAEIQILQFSVKTCQHL